MSTDPNKEPVKFVFNAVITHLKLFSDKIKKPKEVDAALKFSGETIDITQSRINVTDFANDRRTELEASPFGVRKKLTENGLVLNVRYQGNVIGTGTMLFEDSFLDRIKSNMQDVTHEDMIPLLKNDECVGTAVLSIMLVIKCDEPVEEPTEQPKKTKEECVGLGPTINDQDIMFIIGDPDPLLKIPTVSCPDTPLEEEGDRQLLLDLDRYRSLRNQRVVLPGPRCPKTKPSFTQLKILIKDYSKIIDSVTEKVKQMDIPICSMELTADEIVAEQLWTKKNSCP